MQAEPMGSPGKENEEKHYIVRTMLAQCSQGSLQNYLNIGQDHGVFFRDQPVLNANDHKKDINFTQFGNCSLLEGKKQQEMWETFRKTSEAGFGYEASQYYENEAVQLFLHEAPCQLDTPTPWINCNEGFLLDGAPALTLQSTCSCTVGGTISIVEWEQPQEPPMQAQSKTDTKDYWKERGI